MAGAGTAPARAPGVILILGGVLCNQWLIGALVAPDGVITSVAYREVLLSGQAVLIVCGLGLVWLAPGWRRVWSVGRVPLMIVWTLIVLEASLWVFNAVYTLEVPQHLKDTLRHEWLEGFDAFNGETRFFVYKPDSLATTYGHRVRINHWGFRGPDFRAREQRGDDSFRIMVLGDSTTLGWAVDEEDRYSDVLARQLRRAYASRSIEVMNFGVGGFETIQEEKLLDRFWPIVQPDFVILGFSINDPNLHYNYYEPYRFAPPEVSAVLGNFLTFRMLEKMYDPAYRTLRKRPGHVDEVWMAYAPESRDWQLFRQSVARIGRFVREQLGRRPIAICLNDVDELKQRGFHRQVVETFETNGFTWVEISPGLVRPVSRFERHPNETSHEHFAAALFAEIVRQGVLDDRVTAGDVLTTSPRH